MGTRTDDTVRLNFFSGDSQEQAPNVERAGTGWRYQLAYRNAGSNKWHHLVTTVWTKKIHDVEKSFVYTLTGECQFVRVRAWNPVGYGPWAWFNNRSLTDRQLARAMLQTIIRGGTDGSELQRTANLKPKRLGFKSFARRTSWPFAPARSSVGPVT